MSIFDKIERFRTKKRKRGFFLTFFWRNYLEDEKIKRDIKIKSTKLSIKIILISKKRKKKKSTMTNETNQSFKPNIFEEFFPSLLKHFNFDFCFSFVEKLIEPKTKI